MRLRSLSNAAVVTIATAGSVINAGPAPHGHGHGHNHRDKRAVKVIDVPGPLVVAYELNGKPIDESEVCEGIKSGSLKWADGSDALPDCSKGAEPVSKPTVNLPKPSTSGPSLKSIDLSAVLPVATSHMPINDFAKEDIRASSNPGTAAPVSMPTSSASLHTQSQGSLAALTTNQDGQGSLGATSSATLQPQTQAPSAGSSTSQGGQGLDRDFPDGELDCTEFPSEYGPISVEWAGLGGWSGIQYVTIKGDAVTHIDTAIPGGSGCKPGAMCSYACPAGYQKSQWPPQQGSTGQSVGGIHCNTNGKLVLTNPGLSKSLCIQGTGAVTVQNKLSNNAAICRTDYPGTENEVVPLNTEPDSTSPLTCPDAATYFKHDGDPTTAQYYINNQGVALQNACIWGTDGSDMGNWAPSYLGVGQDVNGKTWLSISSTAQNDPKSYTPLNFTVKITGHTSGNCGLSNGKYCSGDNYENCNNRGCTVELMSGQATYVLADGHGLSD